MRDGKDLRRTALGLKVPIITTVAGARATALALRGLVSKPLDMVPLQVRRLPRTAPPPAPAAPGARDRGLYAGRRPCLGATCHSRHVTTCMWAPHAPPARRTCVANSLRR